LSLALNQINDDQNVLLIECDLIFDDTVIAKALSLPDKNVALVDKYELGMDGTVISINDGIINHIFTTQSQGKDFDFSDKYKTLNIYYFTKSFCHGTFAKMLDFYASSIDNNCYYEFVISLIVFMRNEEVNAVKVEKALWAEIDDPNDLEYAEFKFNKQRQKEILDNSFGAYWNFKIKDFAYMHNPYFPSESMAAVLKNHCFDVIKYYGSSQDNLNKKLAYYEQCDSEYIVALNGLSQIYPILKGIFSGKVVAIPSPSFGEYQRCFSNAITYADNAVGVDDLLKNLKYAIAQAEVVVIVNPNNPSGTVIESGIILDFIRSNLDKTFIVDESFIDFTVEDSLLSSIDKYDLTNVLLLKSMSKVWGVPGLRIGYAYTMNHTFRADILAEIPIWNMNSLSEYFMELVLKYRMELTQSLVKLASVKQEFVNSLESFSFVRRVYSSCDNFILVDLSFDSNEMLTIENTLLEKFGIYIKNVTNKFEGRSLEDQCQCWRLAVNTQEDNDMLLRALASLNLSGGLGIDSER
jgi:histidinol-phosphate/aromatic aminotransferase/cobyric acid decarboxylase-like protein